MNHPLPVEQSLESVDARGAPALELIAGILPFLVFGLMFTLKGMNYHRPLPWMQHSIDAYLIAHVILVVGLGIGWILCFPRWSYAYLGAVMITSTWLAGVSTAGFSLFGYMFGREPWAWRGWMPLLALAAVVLLFTRSLRPLAQLFQGVRSDWTRLSFTIYAGLSWLFLAVTYDGKTWYNQTRYLPLNLALLTLVLASGAFLYMHGRRSWPRTLALPAALVTFVLVSGFVTALDGRHSTSAPTASVASWLSSLVPWLIWILPPLLPGVARAAWRRFQPA